MINYFYTTIRKTFNFKDRTNRAEYWWFILAYLVLTYLLNIINLLLILMQVSDITGNSSLVDQNWVYILTSSFPYFYVLISLLSGVAVLLTVVAVPYIVYFFSIFAELGFATTIASTPSTPLVSIVAWIVSVFGLLLVFASVSAGVRRLHDSNKSGWWLLIPFYNLYLLIREGTRGPNFYGPDPKMPEVAMPVPSVPPTAAV